MADYCTTAVFRPNVALEEDERLLLCECGAKTDGPDEQGRFYVYFEEGFQGLPDSLEDCDAGDKIQGLVAEAVSQLAPGTPHADLLGEDLILFVLQRALRRMPPDVARLEGEVAFTCSKMRSDGFGGAWYFISREEIAMGGTGPELERLERLASLGHSLDIPGKALLYYEALARIAAVGRPGRSKDRIELEAEGPIQIAREALGIPLEEDRHERA
jgi:hypothetical protein